jgi:hypothetical protein
VASVRGVDLIAAIAKELLVGAHGRRVVMKLLGDLGDRALDPVGGPKLVGATQLQDGSREVARVIELGRSFVVHACGDLARVFGRGGRLLRGRGRARHEDGRGNDHRRRPDRSGTVPLTVLPEPSRIHRACILAEGGCERNMRWRRERVPDRASPGLVLFRLS